MKTKFIVYKIFCRYFVLLFTACVIISGMRCHVPAYTSLAPPSAQFVSDFSIQNEFFDAEIADFQSLEQRKLLALSLVLRHVNWDTAQASKIISLTRDTIDALMKTFNIRKPPKTDEYYTVSTAWQAEWLNWRAIEREACKQAFDLSNGNIKKAHILLGISVEEAEDLMKKYHYVPAPASNKKLRERVRYETEFVHNSFEAVNALSLAEMLIKDHGPAHISPETVWHDLIGFGRFFAHDLVLPHIYLGNVPSARVNKEEQLFNEAHARGKKLNVPKLTEEMRKDSRFHGLAHSTVALDIKSNEHLRNHNAYRAGSLATRYVKIIEHNITDEHFLRLSARKKQACLMALTYTQWNTKKAAKILDIGYTTIIKWIHTLNIERLSTTQWPFVAIDKNSLFELRFEKIRREAYRQAFELANRDIYRASVLLGVSQANAEKWINKDMANYKKESRKAILERVNKEISIIKNANRTLAIRTVTEKLNAMTKKSAISEQIVFHDLFSFGFFNPLDNLLQLSAFDKFTEARNDMIFFILENLPPKESPINLSQLTRMLNARPMFERVTHGTIRKVLTFDERTKNITCFAPELLRRLIGEAAPGTDEEDDYLSESDIIIVENPEPIVTNAAIKHFETEINTSIEELKKDLKWLIGFIKMYLRSDIDALFLKNILAWKIAHNLISSLKDDIEVLENNIHDFISTIEQDIPALLHELSNRLMQVEDNRLQFVQFLESKKNQFKKTLAEKHTGDTSNPSDIEILAQYLMVSRKLYFPILYIQAPPRWINYLKPHKNGLERLKGKDKIPELDKSIVQRISKEAGRHLDLSAKVIHEITLYIEAVERLDVTSLTFKKLEKNIKALEFMVLLKINDLIRTGRKPDAENFRKSLDAVIEKKYSDFKKHAKKRRQEKKVEKEKLGVLDLIRTLKALPVQLLSAGELRQVSKNQKGSLREKCGAFIAQQNWPAAISLIIAILEISEGKGLQKELVSDAVKHAQTILDNPEQITSVSEPEQPQKPILHGTDSSL